MNDEFFVDTNTLVYAFDESEKEKRVVVKNIVERGTKGEIQCVVSNQVLAETFIALTSRIENPVKKEDAQTIVKGFIDSAHWKKINYTSKTVARAMENSIKENSHFWDALITETMLENGIYSILTENTKHFKSKHVKATNPFTK